MKPETIVEACSKDPCMDN